MRATTAYRIGTSLFAGASLAAAAATLWPIYQSRQFLVLAALCIPVGAAVAIAGTRFRLGSSVVAGITAALYLVLGVPLAAPSAAVAGVLPSWKGLAELIASSALAWKRLLTISLPVGDYQALLVPAFLLLLIGSVVTVTVALRARHPQFAALGPLTIWLAGVLFGPERAWWPLLTGGCLLALLVGWLSWIGWQEEALRHLTPARRTAPALRVRADTRRMGARRLVAAALAIAVAVGGGAVIAALLPGTSPRDVLRAAFSRPFDVRDYASPLSGFRSYLQKPRADETMLSVRGLTASDPSGAVRMRIATLDSYNGVVYSVGGAGDGGSQGSFARVPGRIANPGSGRSEHLTVTIGHYSGVWLPATGALQQVSFRGSDAARLTDSFYYNRHTGTAAVLGGVGAGDRYELDTGVPSFVTAGSLAATRPGSAALTAPAVVPAELDRVLDDYTEGKSGAGAKLAAALRGLSKNGYISHGLPGEPASLSGHGANRITRLLTEVPMVGDAEQYAVTAALMATRLGYPARVVLGFAATAAPSASSPSVSFTGSDITAWIEVQTAKHGWVGVDPNPPVRPIPEKDQSQAGEIARPRTIVPPPPKEAAERHQPPARAQVEQRDAPESPSLADVLLGVAATCGWALLALALILSPFAAIIAAKARRRTLRNRRDSPALRIRGAWLEFEDSALDHGHPRVPGATRSEFAASVGGARSVALAQVADRATFSPVPPSDLEADRVWEALEHLRTALGAGKTRRRRLAAALSLRSFRPPAAPGTERRP